MKKIIVFLCLFALVGCNEESKQPEWEDYNKDDYDILHETDEYIIYEKIEYVPTKISYADYFSESCRSVVDMPNVYNYLLYYKGEFHPIVEGVEYSLYNGEDLVELGVQGIFCE